VVVTVGLLGTTPPPAVLSVAGEAAEAFASALEALEATTGGGTASAAAAAAERRVDRMRTN
jgi:hypothetical protein